MNHINQNILLQKHIIMKKYTYLLLSLIAVISCSCSPKKEKSTYDKDFTVFKTTELKINSSQFKDYGNKTKSSKKVQNDKNPASVLNIKLIAKKGEKVTPLYRTGKYDLLVKLKTGEIGTLRVWDLEEFRQLKKNKKLVIGVKGENNRWKSTEIEPNTKGKIIETPPYPQSHPIVAKFENGLTGNIAADEIAETIPIKIKTLKYERQFYFENKIKKKVLGLDVENLEEELFPLDYLVYTDKEKRNGYAFIDKISVYRSKLSHDGVQFVIKDGKVSALSYPGSWHSKWYAGLPLKRLAYLIPLKVVNYSITSDYYFNVTHKVEEKITGNDIILGISNVFFWFTFILALLIGFIIGVRLIWNDNISNGSLILIVFGISFFFTYLIWLSVAMNTQEEVTLNLLIRLGLLFLFISIFNKNIKYNRCANCNTYAKAKSLGSTYEGTERNVTWSERKEYKGTTTEETEKEIITTTHYDVHQDATIHTYNHFDDHQVCKKCGYKWKIRRTVKAGTETIRG
jgi:hypothetical protein